MSSQDGVPKGSIAKEVPERAEAETDPVFALECPAELGPAARQEWDCIVAELGPSGILRNVDRGPLAIYCTAYGRWVEAEEAIRTYGAVMKSPTGYPVQSPYVAIANRHIETMLRIASEFGFTPASRGRISMPLKDDPKLHEAQELKPLGADLAPFEPV